MEVNRLRLDMTHFLNHNFNSLPIFNAYTILKMPFGTCQDYGFAAMVFMRSKGIPVAMDYTPQWPNRMHGHSWNVVLTNRHENVMFSAFSTNPNSPHYPNNPFGKVLRYTFQPNEKVIEILNKDKFLPTSLNNIFMQDVSDEYMRTDNITVKPNIKEKVTGTPYIAVFNNFEWKPIYWGIKKSSKITYERLGRNVIYLPVHHKNERMFPIGLPLF